MSSEGSRPFINTGALCKETNSYVQFPSQSDAMIASLQFFCRIMNLIISAVSHPNFDAKQVTLKSSVDVIQITEEARLQDRMSVVHRRSLNVDGHMEQTKFPQYVLYQVLDIVHARRQEAIKRFFERSKDEISSHEEEDNVRQFCERSSEDDVLSNMSLVHRSWTIPAQQTLGRILCIRKAIGKFDAILQPKHRATYGPWTTAVAIGLLAPDHSQDIDRDVERQVIEFGLLKKFESLHRMLLSLPNLKRIYVRSYFALLTGWSNFTLREMVRQNTHLEELMLQSMDTHPSPITPFNLDYIIENETMANNLQSLSIRGASFSNEVRDSLSKRASFARLRSLSIGGSSDSIDPKILSSLLSALSARSDPHLHSFSVQNVSYYALLAVKVELSSRQCASLFEHLTTLNIDSLDVDRWITWISPYCSRLETFSFTASPFSNLSNILSHLPTVTQSLHLQIRDDEENPMHLRAITQRVEDLLEITSSTFHVELKLFTLKVPGAKQKDYMPDIRDAIRIYDGRMREFSIKMKAACDESGIEFNFSQEEQALDYGR